MMLLMLNTYNFQCFGLTATLIRKGGHIEIKKKAKMRHKMKMQKLIVYLIFANEDIVY